MSVQIHAPTHPHMHRQPRVPGAMLVPGSCSGWGREGKVQAWLGGDGSGLPTRYPGLQGSSNLGLCDPGPFPPSARPRTSPHSG